MNYLHKQKISIPGDIAVAGYDGISLGKYSFPSLTTYAQDFERAGTEIVGLLYKQLDKNSHEPIEVLLDGKLLIRDST